MREQIGRQMPHCGVITEVWSQHREVHQAASTWKVAGGIGSTCRGRQCGCVTGEMKGG